MPDDITLTLTVKEVDFIANLLAQVPTGTTLQAGMLTLLPKIAAQAQAGSGTPTPEA